MAVEPAHLGGTVKKCPRCDHTDTKFRYNNNDKPSQPRYLCHGCRKHFTLGGKIRKAKAMKLPTTDRAGGVDERRLRRTRREDRRTAATAMATAQLRGREAEVVSGNLQPNISNSPPTGDIEDRRTGAAALQVEVDVGNLQPNITNASSSGSAPAKRLTQVKITFNGKSLVLMGFLRLHNPA